MLISHQLRTILPTTIGDLVPKLVDAWEFPEKDTLIKGCQRWNYNARHASSGIARSFNLFP